MTKNRMIFWGGLVCVGGIFAAYLLWQKPESRQATARHSAAGTSAEQARNVPRDSVEQASSLRPSGPNPPSATRMVAPPAESDGPITAVASIQRAGEKPPVELKALDGEFQRVVVEPNEVLTIRLALEGLSPNRAVRVDADNGGSLNRKLGPLILTPKAGEQQIEFQYAVGGDRGKYTLFIRQGQRREFMEFWVGPEFPQGKPGPYREFNPDKL